jgi:hypothetical protein
MRLAEVMARLRGESGGVLVMVAVTLPLLVILTGFVIDVANWFEHKRHLQLQADAAALAGAREFHIPCADQSIVDKTTAYGGGTYNAQIGGTSPTNVHMLINSRNYYNQPSRTDSTVVTGQPCTAKMVDVKMTETELPWYFKAARVPFINAHARVSLMQVDTASGSLPVGVPDVNPKKVRVTFIDESNGSPLAATDLVRQSGTVNGLALWDNSGSPLPVTTNVQNIGVRVAVGGHTSTTCGAPLVQCYDSNPSSPPKGVLYAQGWSAAGSGAQPNAPLARSVTLFNGTCSDPYFVSSSSSCTIGVRAKVDFGSLGPTAVGAGLTATVNGTDYPLSFNSSSSTWTSGAVTVPPNAGPLPVTLKWAETIGTQGVNVCKTGNGNKCTGTFGTVQRTFSATSGRSGPIKLAQISESGSFWANSFERCSSVQTRCTHNLVVTIGISGSLRDASSVNDPVVSLRVAGGSENQSLDCDPGYSNLWQELAYGCRPSYTKNSGTACPSNAGTLWGSPQPWTCTAIQTGNATNQVSEGVNTRILGSDKPASCTHPNHWSDFPNFSPSDPRIVQVFLTPFGSFDGSGNTVVPVTDFATFYVTGWTSNGNGFDNPCQGKGDDPVPGNDPGLIVGHFIKYIDSINNSSGSGFCDFDSFGTCVATLTE